MGIVESIVGIFVFLLSTTFGLALIVPFVGIVVRYRVNYNPRAINLGPSGDAIGITPEGSEDGRVVGPRVTSLLSMFLRVRRIEGWKGLYKGFSEYRLRGRCNGGMLTYPGHSANVFVHHPQHRGAANMDGRQHACAERHILNTAGDNVPIFGLRYHHVGSCYSVCGDHEPVS